MKHTNADRPGVEHPTVDDLFRFFAGEMEEGESESTLRHLSQCSDCRGSFESRREEFRDRMIDTAAERGHLPPDRSGLRERVFRAVARDRANRKPVPRRVALPLHPRAVLVAAAALILVAIGVRYLGDSRWNGRLLSQGGAQTLVTDDGDRFAFVTEEEHEVGEGDLVLVLPGPPARLDLPGGSRVDLPAPALIALDSATPDSHGDRPRLLVGRGYVEIDTGGGPPLVVNAAGIEFTVDGIAEFSVQTSSRSEAFEWATATIGPSARASFLPSAHATSSVRSVFRARVFAHSREGTVLDRSGLRIYPGQASTFYPGSGPSGWGGSPPVRVGNRSILRPDAGFLGADELAALRELLVRTGGDREELARVLDEPVGATPSPPCLAAWLLGEMGHPAGAAPLRRVLDAVPVREAGLRSAAAASLVRLGDGNSAASTWDLVHDDQLAVAEAVLLVATKARPEDAVARLKSVFDDEARPSALRVLAAALLRWKGHPVPNALLFGFLTDEDPSVAAMAARTLARHEGGPFLLARYLAEADDGLAAVILQTLGGQRYRDAAEPARAALLRTTGRDDPASRAVFAAALNYLGGIRADGIDDAIERALRDGDAAAQRAALSSLTRRTDIAKHRLTVDAILRSRDESTHLRLQALRLLHRAGSVSEELLGTGDAEFEGTIRSRLLRADATGRRAELARESFTHSHRTARRAAWGWLARHEPEDAVERASAWMTEGGAEDADAVVAALAAVPESLLATSRPKEEVRRLLDRVAAILGAVVEKTADRPKTENAALDALGELARGGRPVDDPRSSPSSPTSFEVLRRLALSAKLPGDLRRRAATILAEHGTGAEDHATIERVLTGPDEALAAATALSFTVRIPAPPADVVERYRKVVVHPRARARLVLCPPFDADYAVDVLDAGDADAAGIVLQSLRREEVTLVRAAVLRRLSDSRALNRQLAARVLDAVPDRVLNDRDPWVRITALVTRIRGGELPPDLDVSAAVAALPEEIPPRLRAALTAFAANAGRETADRVRKALGDAPPLAAFRNEQVGFDPPSRSFQRALAAASWNQWPEQRRTSLARIAPGNPPAHRVRAAGNLAATGSRGDIAILFRVAEDEEVDAEVRRAAIRAAAALLSRQVDVADPGPALARLRAWWSERSLALTVPVLPH